MRSASRRRCARCCCGTAAIRRGLIAYLQRGIDKSRDGYVAVVRPLARRALISGVLVVAFALGDGMAGKDRTDRLPARGGPGRLFCRDSASGRRIAEPHEHGRGASREA